MYFINLSTIITNIVINKLDHVQILSYKCYIKYENNDICHHIHLYSTKEEI